MGFNWTAEAVSVVTQGWAVGRPTYDIACEIGATQGAVIGKAHRLGLGVHPYRAKWPTKKEKRRNIHRRDRFRIPKIDTDPLPKVVAGDPLNVPFMELTFEQCRYPVTESSPHLFCGHPQHNDSSYCAFHHQVCTGTL